jgi:hypothetical protein
MFSDALRSMHPVPLIVPHLQAHNPSLERP